MPGPGQSLERVSNRKSAARTIPSPARDIKAVIGQFQFAELQAISYSITREKAPIYTMGSADPRSYSRNKRGIAGSIIWINFDRHALLALFNKAKGKFGCQTALQSRFSYSFGPFPTMEIRYRVVGPNVGFI